MHKETVFFFMQHAIFGDLHGEAKSAIKDECPFWGTKRRGPSVRQIRTLSKIWLAINVK